MDGMLSQDEINALLNGMSADDSADNETSETPQESNESASDNTPNTDKPEALSDTEKDAVGEISNISMGTAATTLSSLLNQKVNITTPRVEVADWDKLSRKYDRPCVMLQIELKHMHDELGITFIYVTHDQEEALTMSDKIVVLSEGRIQQIGTPEDIYNEPQNAFVADFIGESNIFKGIMTGHMKVRFCGGEFIGMDDVPEGTLVDVVVRPEDVIITKPEDGIIEGEVVSVIFKGMHYEVTVESGKYEMVIRTTKCYSVGERIGMKLEPDGIHIMLAEDHTTSFVTNINSDYTLDFNGKVINCDLTKVIPKSSMKNNVLVDENNEAIDTAKLKVMVSIQPYDIRMSDNVEEGLVSGHIINLIYKGDHYSYVIRTEYGHDLIVDDEYLWNMDDAVGLVMLEDKMKFQLKK